MRTIAIDFGGTRIKIGIVEKEVIIASKVITKSNELNFNQILDLVESTINDLIGGNQRTIMHIKGLGLSMPGIINTERMSLLSVNEKYSDAVGFDFTQWAKKKWGLPVILENDARAALVGEWKHGAGKGCDNLAVVTLGTGIGGAVVIEGKVLHGKHYQAGCLPGHFILNYEGAQCNCGNIGCAEAEASSWRLPKMAAEHPLFQNSKLKDTAVIDYQAVFNFAAQKDPLAEILVEKSLRVWSACIVNIVHAYDPEMIIIGGGIMKSADIIIPYIKNWVNNHAWTPWGKVEIVQAMDIDRAALLGMGYLMENY